MRHEAEIKSNAYWLGLLAHLQASSVPRKVKWEHLLERIIYRYQVEILLLEAKIESSCLCCMES